MNDSFMVRNTDWM